MSWLEFTAPQRLWALLGIVVILLLALPPRPQREVLTAYLPQWLRARARLRQKKVRYRWLRTLLAVLAFASAIAAWSGPRRPAVPGPTRLTVLVDASASLAAPGTAGSAWTALQARLAAGLAALPPHVRAATQVWRADATLTALSLEPELQLGAPVPCGLGFDLARAAQGAAIDADAAVWTLGDGQASVPAVGAVSMFGAAADNAAIVALRVEDRWPLPDVVVEVAVACYAAAPLTTTLTLRAGADVLDDPPLGPVELGPVELGAVELQLTPAPTVQRFALRRRRGGEVVVALGSGGALAADDQVAFTLPGPPAPRIAVASDSDAPVLRAAAWTLAAETGGEVVAAGDEDAKASYVLVEGGTQLAEAWANLPGMTFGTVLSPATGEAPRPTATAVRDWERDHAITRGLDLSELAIARLSAAVPGDSLVHGEAGPLLAWRGRALHAAFRLTDSNLWALPAFPQLLRRAYAAAHAEQAAVRLAADNLLDPVESDLRGRHALERPLPAFGAPPLDLTAWFALAALALFAARIFA